MCWTRRACRDEVVALPIVFGTVNTTRSLTMQDPVEQWATPRRARHLAPKWLALFAGLCFAIPGMCGVVSNVLQFDKFATRTWMETREGPGNYAASSVRVVRLSDSQHGIIHNGFESGGTALFCMLCFTAGVGVAACRFLDVAGRKNLWLLLGATWHVLGSGAWVAYVHLAPRPLDAMPLAFIGAYEWAGMLLVALGLRETWFKGRLQEATWNLWFSSGVGGVIGAIVGGVIDFVRFSVLKEPTLDGFAVRWWVYGGLLGSGLIGLSSFIWTVRQTGRIVRPGQPRTGSS